MVLPGPSVLFLLIRRGASVLSLDYEVCVFSRMSVLHVPLPCRTRVSSPPFRVHYIPCVRSLKGNLKRKQIPSRSVTRPPETAEALHTLKDSDRGAEVGACVHPGEGGRAPPLRGGGGGGGLPDPAAFAAPGPHSPRYGLIRLVTASSTALRPHRSRYGLIRRAGAACSAPTARAPLIGGPWVPEVTEVPGLGPSRSPGASLPTARPSAHQNKLEAGAGPAGGGRRAGAGSSLAAAVGWAAEGGLALPPSVE